MFNDLLFVFSTLADVGRPFSCTNGDITLCLFFILRQNVKNKIFTDFSTSSPQVLGANARYLVVFMYGHLVN